MSLMKNEVTMEGFLGRDAEIRTTKNGFTIISFSVANKWGKKNPQSGLYEDQTDWYSCTAFGDEYLQKAQTILKKGKRIVVRGYQHFEKFVDKSGNQRSELVLFVKEFGLSSNQGAEPTRESQKSFDPGTIGDFNEMDIPF